MRNVKLHKTIILVGAIALGCVSVTIDAFARSAAGGVGGAGVGHAAPSSGVASGHASTAARGGPAGRATPSRADGSFSTRIGHVQVSE
jgi:hypothetical protein